MEQTLEQKLDKLIELMEQPTPLALNQKMSAKYVGMSDEMFVDWVRKNKVPTITPNKQGRTKLYLVEELKWRMQKSQN